MNILKIIQQHFQFHKGTIKTQGERWGAHSPRPFNSIKVQLRLHPIRDYLNSLTLSIP